MIINSKNIIKMEHVITTEEEVTMQKIANMRRKQKVIL